MRDGVVLLPASTPFVLGIAGTPDVEQDLVVRDVTREPGGPEREAGPETRGAVCVREVRVRGGRGEVRAHE